MDYFNSSGKRLVLGKSLGSGAAATVYCDSSNPNTAIKIFNDRKLQEEKNLTFRLKKLVEITQVVDFSLKIGAHNRYVGSFPRDLVLDSSKKVVGYLMEQNQNSFDLTHILMARDENAFLHVKKNMKNNQLADQLKHQFVYDPNKTIYNRFVLCSNLALAFSKFYPPKSKNGNNVGLKILNYDIKPKNIHVYTLPISGKYAIIPFVLDLDNVTLQTKTQNLSPVSPQFTPEYMAPEGRLDEFYDYFSIAIILYQLIFDIHPYNVRGGTRFSDGETMEYYVNNRCFAWGKNRKFLTPQTKNNWRHNNFNFISPQLQTLFIRAFDSEIRSNRPAPSEWFAELKAFIMVNNGKLNTLFKSA